MRISDWSSDVCSSDLPDRRESIADHHARNLIDRRRADGGNDMGFERCQPGVAMSLVYPTALDCLVADARRFGEHRYRPDRRGRLSFDFLTARHTCSQIDSFGARRSEEHTSELQSLMPISYSVF